MEIENPCDVSVPDPLFDFKIIQLKFKKTFYDVCGRSTDRDYMTITELDLKYENWMENYMTMENGLIEFTIPKTGRYEIIQKSRSTNVDGRRALGVTVQFVLNLERVKSFKLEILFIIIKEDKLFIFIADTIFLFDRNKKLISVPGSSGGSGNYLGNGSLTNDLQHSDHFVNEADFDEIGYGYKVLLFSFILSIFRS